MIYSETLKHVMNFSALTLVLATTFSTPAHADDAWLRACANAKTADGCQQPFQQGLAPVLMGSSRDEQGLWGYIDTSGQMAIEPAYREARGFVNDLAAVKKDDLFGYIDVKGNFAIAPRFTRATDFNSQGTALVVTDNRLALIDRKGAVIKTLPFAASLDSEGFKPGQSLASVQMQISPALWNASTGRSLALPDDVMNLDEPQSGLIPAQVRDTGQSGYWGYLDDNGGWAIEPVKLKTRNEPVLNGDVIAVKGKSSWVFVDKSGVSLSKEQFKSVKPLSSGSWLVVDANNTQQLLSNKLEKIQDIPADQADAFQAWGNWLVGKGAKGVVMIGPDNRVIDVKATRPQLLSQNGHLWILQADSRQGEDKSAQLVQIYDANGVGLVTPSTLTALNEYKVQPLDTRSLEDATANSQSAGLPMALLTPVDKKKTPSVLTAQGEIFTSPQWAAIGPVGLRGPLVVKTENGTVGAIDANGQWAIQPKFKQITPFDGAYTWASVVDDKNVESRKVIDTQGNVIDIPTRVIQTAQGISGPDLLYTQGDDSARRWGIWDIAANSGKIAPKFIQLESFHEGYALAKVDSGWGVIDGKGQWAIAPDAAQSGKPQPVGDSIFVVSDGDQPGEHSDSNRRYSLYSAVTGLALATDLLSNPQKVGDSHWLIQPSNGGVGLMDDDGRSVVSKEIVPESVHVEGNWALLHFGPHFGAIDSQGDWQIAPVYSAALNFIAPQNWASALSDKRITLIDANGVEPLQDKEGAQPLASMDRIAMNDDNTGETVLYDTQGNEIKRYSGLSSIAVAQSSEGMVPLRGSNGLYGFIDSSGKALIGSYFTQVGAMKDTRAKAVKQDTYGSQIGYINGTGTFTLLPKFDWATDFSEKRAWVAAKGLVQLINTDGAVQAQLPIRCNQRVIVDAKDKQTWPAKTVSCASSAQAGGAQ
ncbi:WG repeat-containing protein [Rouxiella sp. S1S-2]|uniref:WG repeat-containing protein n=1 Tax=Rouxiella sp. S1S-2 TaxID=2653856 RepID=UPI001264EF83|nr:WG repeat-containing protein [Rouxiella sp. S1S-2]KAB7896074.1 WG repeat-containing protein [Rouxiella sp. S1S-2]